MRAAFYTLGCKLNQSESEALATAFGRRGFSLVKPSTRVEADIFIINSCTVTGKAEQKARRMIRAFARNNPASAVLVSGCYAQLDPDAIRALGGNVLVLSLDEKAALLDLPEFLERAAGEGYGPLEAVRCFLLELSRAGNEQAEQEASKAGNRNRNSSAGRNRGQLSRQKARDRFRFEDAAGLTRSRAFLKVQDGCDNRCGYCRVRIARGPSVSLSLDEVVSRALRLEAQGFREIVLTGVNLTAWRGEPVSPGAYESPHLASTPSSDPGLPLLLRTLTGSLKSCRIRLSSLEPDMITPELAEAISHPLVRPHFHLPVQSGSDAVLARSGRKYGAQAVLDAVGCLGSTKEKPFLAADIITGLPGEGDDDFEATLELVRACGFAHIHAFPFSPRPGTPLFDAPGKVPERISGQRLARLSELSREQYRDYLTGQLGREREAVIERRLEDGRVFVLTDNYLHLPCRFPSDPLQHQSRQQNPLQNPLQSPLRPGELCRVRIGREYLIPGDGESSTEIVNTPGLDNCIAFFVEKIK